MGDKFYRILTDLLKNISFFTENFFFVKPFTDGRPRCRLPHCVTVSGQTCTTAPSSGKRRKKRNNNNNGNGVLRSGYTFVAAELQIQCWSPSSANKAALQGWRLLTNNPLLEIHTYFIQ